MKKNFDKTLVSTTFYIFVTVIVVMYLFSMLPTKKINIENGLVFGNENSSIKIVVFEDFTCDFCKKLSSKYLPEIKEKYIDTNKISYTIIPLAYFNGSELIANAAVYIYKNNKNRFFDFLKIISEENPKIKTKEELIAVVKNFKDLNFKIFEEFLNEELYKDYLDENLKKAKKVLKPLQVPTIYLNGNKIKMSQIDEKIEEAISYKTKK